MKLSATERLLGEIERSRQTPIQRAMAAGGLRVASPADGQHLRDAGLASRFTRTKSIPVRPPGASLLAPKAVGVIAHTCPRCKQPTDTVRLANSTPVQYCVSGCRYVVPLPTSNLMKES